MSPHFGATGDAPPQGGDLAAGASAADIAPGRGIEPDGALRVAAEAQARWLSGAPSDLAALPRRQPRAAHRRDEDPVARLRALDRGWGGPVCDGC